MTGKQLLTASLLAVALTVVFWWPLWLGGGLIGGDLYSYFLPQKQYFAEQWRQGELPLWNHQTGHGYPVVAESQTGVLYPPDLLLYRWLDVNTAYNVNQLLHYALAFLFAWLYARKLGQSALAASLAALVYVYGWFPPRLCLEWAIIGGMYLPLGLWLLESFLQSGRTKYPLLLSLALGLQLLSGHFNLAFIHLLVLTVYGPARLWWAKEGLHPELLARRKVGLAWLAGSLAAGLLLAAAQLLPTWELKQQSQREGVSAEFDPGYGHIPPLYWSQTVASWWYWHDPEIDVDQVIGQLSWGAYPAGTNRVEAHLYFGLLPLLLAVWLLLSRLRTGRQLPRLYWLWLLLGLGGLIYASGWLLPVTKHLPGFGFFRGPGRYGIIPTLAVALWAGRAWDESTVRFRPASRWILYLLLVSLTTADLWLASRLVTYVIMAPDPAIEHLEESPLRQRFADELVPPRIYAPGPNLPNLLGISQTPVYLGLGPAAYFDPRLALPDAGHLLTTFSPEQLDWLRRAGVTYLLTFEPLPAPPEELEPVWSGPDPFLNRAWGRHPREPMFLYRLKSSPGRLRWAEDEGNRQAEITRYEPDRIEIHASGAGGTLILSELAYPGWQASVDGEPAESLTIEETYRGVSVPAGEHLIVWSYRPASLRRGAWISGLTLLALLASGLALLPARRAGE